MCSLVIVRAVLGAAATNQDWPSAIHGKARKPSCRARSRVQAELQIWFHGDQNWIEAGAHKAVQRLAGFFVALRRDDHDRHAPG